MSAEKTPANDPSQDPKDPLLEAMLHEDKSAVKKKKKRWWLRVVGIIFALIILLIVCAPYIASFGFVRSIVVSKINDNLRGSVKLDDYSLGWLSGVSAQGVEVYDADKKLVISIPHVSTELSLIGAMRGKFDLGDTKIDVKLDNITIDENGKTNLESIAKPEESVASHPHEKKDKSDVIDVPSVRGKITINIVGGTISGPGVSAPITIEPGSSIVLDIADINQPIKDSIKLAYRVGDAPVSTISASGSVDAVRDNKIDPKTIDLKLKADQKLALENVNLAAVEPIVKKQLGSDAKLSGVLHGGLDMTAAGITGISATGEFAIDNLLFTGGGLNDQLMLDRVSMPIQITRTTSGSITMVKIEKLGVNSSLANLNVSGELDEDALTRLIQRQKPSGAGHIDIVASVPNFAMVAKALPKTLRLEKDVEVTGGSLTSTQQIVIADDRATSTQKLDVVASGKRNGQNIQLSPIHLETTGSYFPQPDHPRATVRDIKLAMTSSFLTLDGQGKSLAATNVEGKMNLANLRKELAQFSDLGDFQLSGDGDLLISTTGDPEVYSSPIGTKLNVNLRNLKFAGGAGETPVEQERLAIAAGGNVLRDKDGIPTAFDSGTLTLQVGATGTPVIDVAASANVDLIKGSVPNFELAKCAITNLKTAQDEFGALVPALKENQIQVESGAINAQVAGSFDGKIIALDDKKPLGFSLTNLVVTKAGEKLLDREDITGKIAGSIATGQAAGAHLIALSVNSTKSDLFAINKSGDAPIDVSFAQGVQGSGAIELSANLKRIVDLVRSPTSGAGQITKGNFGGTLKLASNANATDIYFDGKLKDLEVTTTGKSLRNETITIAASAKCPANQSIVNVQNASVESRFATAKLSDGALNLDGGTWDLVQHANVDVNVPDLAAVWTLKNAFAPPPTAMISNSTATEPMLLQKKPRKKPTETPPPTATVNTAPLDITSGSATMKLSIKRDPAAKKTSVELTDCKISNLAMKRGEQAYPFTRDVTFALKSSIVASSTANLSPVQQISSLKIEKLDGDLGVAKLSMPQPFEASGLADMQTLAANGSVRVEGKFADVTPLLAVMNGGAPLPYVGSFNTNEMMATRADKAGPIISLTGDVAISDFECLDNGKPVFSEKQINLRNDIELQPSTELAQVKSITLDMPQSQAVSVKFSGQVNNWSDQRVISAVGGTKTGPAKLELAYDLEKLWPIVKPMLSPDMQESLKDAKIAGKYPETFNISGKFPQREHWQDSLKYLTANGSFAMQLFDGMGLNVTNLVVPVMLDGGVLKTTSKEGAAKPATCNGGMLDISNIAVTFAGTDMRVSIPKGQKLLDKVTINPLLGDSLGKFVNPMFANNKRSQGLLNVTMNYCENLALGDKMKTPDSGRAQIAMGITDMDIANPMGSLMFGKIIGAIPSLGGSNGFASGQSDTFKGELKDCVATVEAGVTTTKGTFLLVDPTTAVDKTGKPMKPKLMPMTFDGTIRLSDLTQNFNVSVPAALVAAFIPDQKIGDTLMKIFPEGIPIAWKGTVTNPKIEVGDIAKKFIEGQIKSGGGIGDIGDILGGGKKKKKGGK